MIKLAIGIMKEMMVLFACVFLIYACRNKSDPKAVREYHYRTDSYSGEDSEDNNCGIEDGTHSATVDYYNPDTGHSATYDLDVEVEDCQVVQLNFPSGGWLDSDHINPEELDTDGYASFEDDRGRTYEVHIEE